jgi:hypothetical protein
MPHSMMLLLACCNADEPMTAVPFENKSRLLRDAGKAAKKPYFVLNDRDVKGLRA